MKEFHQLDLLNLVEYLMRVSSETVDNLRLRVYGSDFTFKDAIPEDAQDEGEDFIFLTKRIVSRYLNRTEAERILRIPEDFRRTQDPIERNVSWFPHLVDFWNREYYRRKKAIDQQIEEASQRIDSIVHSISNEASEAIRRSTGIELCLHPSSSWAQSWLFNRSREDLYRKAGLFEDPVFLYELCFGESVQIKGWDKLKDEELLSALKTEKVPLEDFEKISGRKIILYLGNLTGWESSFDLSSEKLREFNQAFTALVEHQDFPQVYNQALTVERIPDRWAFILRKAYEIGDEKEILIGAAIQQHPILFQKRLEEYGLVFLCPYFRPDQESITRESCLIDTKTEEEPISTTCGGRSYQCRIYNSRCSKIPLGESNLPQRTETMPPKFRIPKMEVTPVDIDDLHDWWEGEGKYE